MNLRIWAFLSLVCCAFAGPAEEAWEKQLALLPLGTNELRLSKMEPMKVIGPAFRGSPELKGIVVMPGLTDTLYFTDRGTVRFTNSTPTLLDAVRVLADRTGAKAIFRPPLLLLVASNDFNGPKLISEGAALFKKLNGRPFQKDWLMIDKEWDHFQPTLARYSSATVLPGLESPETWHFYRVCFVARGLTCLEAVELISMATQTEVHADGKRLLFNLRSDRPTGHN
jgi:hypothetical protein